MSDKYEEVGPAEGLSALVPGPIKIAVRDKATGQIKHVLRYRGQTTGSAIGLGQWAEQQPGPRVSPGSPPVAQAPTWTPTCTYPKPEPAQSPVPRTQGTPDVRARSSSPSYGSSPSTAGTSESNFPLWCFYASYPLPALALTTGAVYLGGNELTTLGIVLAFVPVLNWFAVIGIFMSGKHSLVLFVSFLVWLLIPIIIRLSSPITRSDA